MRPTHPWIVALALSVPLVGCGSDSGTDFGPCRVDYLTVSGAPSDRVDSLAWNRARSVLVRAIYEDGRGRPDAAIYYLIDEDGRTVVEAMDEGANGDIEARLDAMEPLGDLITPFVVDMNLQDGATDRIQLSVNLPTTPIGPFNPARAYYQVPCDQDAAVTTHVSDDLVDVALFIGDEEEPRTRMGFDFAAEGAPQGWNVDLDGDGETDDFATIRYNDAGHVREVAWTRPGQFLGDTYARSFFDYDTDGNLFRYRADVDGDGGVDHEITYSRGCYGPAFNTEL